MDFFKQIIVNKLISNAAAATLIASILGLTSPIVSARESSNATRLSLEVFMQESKVSPAEVRGKPLVLSEKCQTSDKAEATLERSSSFRAIAILFGGKKPPKPPKTKTPPKPETPKENPPKDPQARARIQVSSETTSDSTLQVTLNLPVDSGNSTLYVKRSDSSPQYTFFQSFPSDGKRVSFPIYLRNGPGDYLLSFYSPTQGDQQLVVRNLDQRWEAKYLLPTTLVNSDSPEILTFATRITAGKSTTREKAEAIHDWVAGNITYDHNWVLNNFDKSKRARDGKATDTLRTGYGICHDYSILTAALLRAVGIPAKYIGGEAAPGGGDFTAHAWNEAYVDGRWISMDVTWDRYNAPIFDQNRKIIGWQIAKTYFDNPKEFDKVHRKTSTPDDLE